MAYSISYQAQDHPFDVKIPAVKFDVPRLDTVRLEAGGDVELPRSFVAGCYGQDELLQPGKGACAGHGLGEEGTPYSMPTRLGRNVHTPNMRFVPGFWTRGAAAGDDADELIVEECAQGESIGRRALKALPHRLDRENLFFLEGGAERLRMVAERSEP